MADTIPRRALLKGLSAAPLAIAASAAPLSALAGTGASQSLDALVIQAAKRIAVLAALDQKACDRQCDATERYEAVETERPKDAQAEIRQAIDAIMDQCPNPVTAADNVVMQGYMRRAGAAGKAVKERHAREQALYEAECARLEQETGLARARRLANYLDERLARAAEALTAMQSATLAGIIAKARALEAVQATAWGDCAVEWRDALALNIGRELLTIGEAQS